MQDEDKSKEQLISELAELRQQLDELKLVEETYRLLENALQETERYYNDFLNLIPVAIFTKNVEGRYTNVNSDTLNYWAQNPIGYTDAELLPADIAGKLRAVDLQVMETGEEHYGEEHLLVNGELRTILSRKVPLKSTDGEIMGIIGISLDISEQKQAEERRMQLEVERKRVQLLSDFITQISHEFRTPLTVIKSSTYLLGKVDDPEKQAKHRENIEQQANNINTLIENMITLSALDSQHTLNPQKVELNRILKHVLRNKKSEINAKGLVCELSLSDLSLLVLGDEEYFERAIEHIWDNAIRHTPNEGIISIRSSIIDSNAVIDIIDNGEGISEDDLPYIFDRFYRADKAGLTRGFGLGLPIAKAIIEFHGGIVSIETTSSAGSHFRISLPIA